MNALRAPALAMCVCGTLAQPIAQAATPATARSVTQGVATTIVANMFDCPGGTLIRPAGFGKATATDGTVWTVPDAVAFQSGPKAPDLYNECNKKTPAPASAVRLEDIPIVIIDPDGEVITGYLIADNYFELYVNGKLVGVDAVPFTPFNSAIVRFKARRPVTYAVKLVDWEENLGLGTERGSAPYHPGDGGFLARFSDGTVTDASWKAQSFYIAPLQSPDDVIEQGNVHATPGLERTYPQAPATAACTDKCYAVHYAQPANWHAVSFDDTQWPQASQFTLADMGAPRLKAYTNLSDVFAGAHVIWSSNLVYDNVVLARKVQP